jgi:hypothetical protein
MGDKGPPEIPKNHDCLLIWDEIKDLKKEIKEDFKYLDKKIEDKFNKLDNKIYGGLLLFASCAGGFIFKRFTLPKPNGKISPINLK